MQSWKIRPSYFVHTMYLRSRPSSRFRLYKDVPRFACNCQTHSSTSVPELQLLLPNHLGHSKSRQCRSQQKQETLKVSKSTGSTRQFRKRKTALTVDRTVAKWSSTNDYFHKRTFPERPRIIPPCRTNIRRRSLTQTWACCRRAVYDNQSKRKYTLRVYQTVNSQAFPAPFKYSLRQQKPQNSWRYLQSVRSKLYYLADDATNRPGLVRATKKMATEKITTGLQTAEMHSCSAK